MRAKHWDVPDDGLGDLVTRLRTNRGERPLHVRALQARDLGIALGGGRDDRETELANAIGSHRAFLVEGLKDEHLGFTDLEEPRELPQTPGALVSAGIVDAMRDELERVLEDDPAEAPCSRMEAQDKRPMRERRGHTSSSLAFGSASPSRRSRLACDLRSFRPSRSSRKLFARRITSSSTAS